MSTKLKSRNPNKVGLTSFGGGKRGPCIQITTARNPDDSMDSFFNAVTLNIDEAERLALDLLDFVNDKEEQEFNNNEPLSFETQ